MAKVDVKTLYGGETGTDEYEFVSQKEFRKEVSRLSSLANKRIKRLENNDMLDSPAYKKFINEGGTKFGIRGKDWNQVQQEMKRVKGFVNSTTSTIKGINSTLKNMADNTGIKYNNLKDLQNKANKFFELASKTEQYLRTVDDMGSAIGYQKIWEVINEYADSNLIDLSAAEGDIDSMVEMVGDLLINAPNNTFDEKALDVLNPDWVLLR